jgi:hypothetical protein
MQPSGSAGGAADVSAPAIQHAAQALQEWEVDAAESPLAGAQ